MVLRIMMLSWFDSCVCECWEGHGGIPIGRFGIVDLTLERRTMSRKSFRRTLVVAAVATALGVLTTPAAAAPYRGTFDPFDFSGDYVINVNPLCLATDGWHANAPGICAATLLSATADVTGDYTGTVEFASSISSNPPLFGLYVAGGKIVSFDTDLLHDISSSPLASQEFWIKFGSGQCTSGPCYGDELGVFLFTGVEFPDPQPVSTASYLGPAVDLAIPEPGTLSLLLGALGGGWLARRRRKEKVPDTN